MFLPWYITFQTQSHLYIKKKILYIVLYSNFHYFKTFFSIRCQKRFVKIIENSSNPLNLKFQLDRLPTNKKLAYHVASTSLLSHVFLEKTYSGKKKKAGKTPLGAGVALELQGGITWYSIKETSPWREQGSLRGELVFAWRDVGEYLRRWRRRATFPCSRHWGLVAKQLEQVLLERKGVPEPSTLISALVAARNDECEMCVTMRGYDASGWKRMEEGSRGEETRILGGSLELLGRKRDQFLSNFLSTRWRNIVFERNCGWMINYSWDVHLKYPGFWWEICVISFLFFTKLNELEKNTYILC